MSERFRDELFEVIARANRKYEAKKAEDPDVGEWYRDILVDEELSHYVIAQRMMNAARIKIIGGVAV